MKPTIFAYSFDREIYRGEFSTRQEAVDAAFASLKNRDLMPDSVYVGQWVQPDAQTLDHASHTIESMRERFKSAESDANYLSAVSDQELADLDYEMDRVIRTWLTKHNLCPQLTKVRAVSEHPVPNVAKALFTNTENETHILGPEN